MTSDFWLSRWDENKIGFHQSLINARLMEYADRIGVEAGARVFVPLCGKTLDMLWLRERGAAVVGVELSEKAVSAFFADHLLEPRISRTETFVRCEAHDIVLLCGDFFALRDSDVEGVTGVYDRAALIALPPELRRRYAGHMASLLAPGTRMLLLTIEYDQSQMDGPPFSVTEDEVRELYGENFSIEALSSADVLDQDPRFAERGVTALTERAYGLVRK
jgi:thiopurine S-methyltransferase